MKYAIIRRKGEHLGLFSYVITNMGAINKFVRQDYVPIIDMMNYKNQYITKEQVGKVNAWELYFEQPCNIGLNDINEDNCLTFDKVLRNRPNDSMRFFLNKKVNNKWRKIGRQYLRLNSEVKKIIDYYQEQYFKNNDKVLGVLCRGTDYISLKPFRHPIQPSVEELFDKIDSVMEKYKCNKIFLATEDQKVLNKFIDKYKDKLIYHDQIRFSDVGKQFLYQVNSERKNDHYLRGLEYLTSIVLLSRCNCFVGGVTSGTVGIQLFNPSFEYEYYFDKGRYGMPNFIRIRHKQK